MNSKNGIVLLVILVSVITTSMLMKNDKSDNIENVLAEQENLEINSSNFEESVVDFTEEINEEQSKNIEVDSSMPYYIKINNLQNVVTIYSKVADGIYEPYKVMLCSTGKATPKSGETHETTSLKCRWSIMKGGVYVQYATQLVDSIFFHSVPYTKEDASTLEYWEYDKLGEAASLGCIRLTAENAKWIYDNIEEGTKVEFYEDENPGPFGKPEGVKISDNEECRGWDPTDISGKNPWNLE